MAYDLTEEQRDRYRETSRRSQLRKQAFLRDHDQRPFQATFDETARLDPNDLMPLVEPNGLACMSLFSGGGGLDLGFERAGFSHLASMEILDICGDTLRANRPAWTVLSGEIDAMKSQDLASRARA